MFIDEECFKGLFVVLGATSVAIDTLAPPLKLQAFRWLMISENWARDARSRLYATGLKDTFNKTSLSLFFFFCSLLVILKVHFLLKGGLLRK